MEEHHWRSNEFPFIADEHVFNHMAFMLTMDANSSFIPNAMVELDQIKLAGDARYCAEGAENYPRNDKCKYHIVL